VRKNGKGCILVDPLPGEAGGVAVDTEHTVYQLLSFLLLDSLERDKEEGDLPNTGSSKVLKDTLRNVDPSFSTARAGILYFGNQGLSLVYSSASFPTPLSGRK